MRKLSLKTLKKNYETKLDKAYRLEYDTETLIARVYRPTPKAKYRKETQEWGYRFKSVEAMTEFVNKNYYNRLANIQTRIKEKEQRKLRNKKEQDEVKVGDIFCYSWGWEQTNVDFYQVISKPSAATIVVREIGYESVEQTSWASDYVVPVKDSFCGKEEKVRLNGKYFTRSCGYATLTDSKSKHYRSWYA